jgi:hypothetical protein
MKHLIWDDLIVYVKVACKLVVELVKISTYSPEALLKGLDETCGARNVLGDGI